jgi:hypothetical protein
LGFERPIFLLGALAVLVPVLFHLLNRKHPRELILPSFALLAASLIRSQRKLTLRRILLLASRIALFLGVPLFLAGPRCRPAPEAFMAGVAPRTDTAEYVLIWLDTSLSMQAAYDGTSTFFRAQRRALEQVEALGRLSYARVVTPDAFGRTEPGDFTLDKNRLAEAVRSAKPTFARASLSEAINQGKSELQSAQAELLAAEPSASPPPPPEATPKRLIILSDGTEAVPTSADPAEDLHIQVEDLLASVDRDKSLNFRVAGQYAPSPDAPQGGLLLVQVTAFGAPSVEGRQQVRVEYAPDHRLHKDVRLKGGESTELVFPLNDAEGKAIELQLSADLAAGDNSACLFAAGRLHPRVLIVDGDPATVRQNDEVFYLEKALETGGQDLSQIRTVEVDELPRLHLGSFRAVVLAGVPALEPTSALALLEFVRGGGGLFIGLSPKIDTAAFAQAFGKVLGDLRAEDSEAVLQLTDPLLTHPLLAPFSGSALSGLLSTQTRGRFRFTPSADTNHQVLLRFDDQSPALIETTHGKGRILLWTSSLDRDLTDLPIRPAFVPLIRKALLHLTLGLDRSATATYRVGQPVTLPLLAGEDALWVHAPERSNQKLTPPPEDDRKVVFTDTEAPGCYAVSAAPGEEGDLADPRLDRSFSVVIDPAESDLRPRQAAEPAADSPEVVVNASSSNGRLLKNSAAPNQTHWTELVLMVWIWGALLIETLLARPPRSKLRSVLS